MVRVDKSTSLLVVGILDTAQITGKKIDELEVGLGVKAGVSKQAIKVGPCCPRI